MFSKTVKVTQETNIAEKADSESGGASGDAYSTFEFFLNPSKTFRASETFITISKNGSYVRF